MARSQGTVVRTEPEGFGYVRLDKPVHNSSNGIFTAQTENVGRVWNHLQVGRVVIVDIEETPDRPNSFIRRIELAPR